MRIRSVVLFFVLMLAMTAGVLAQSGGGFDLSWWTVDGGGGRLTGNGFTLEGSVGQPDAGTLQGGGYVLYGGFWSPEEAASPEPTRTPTPTPGTPGCPDPYEPNDDFSQARPIIPGTTIQAYICTEGEQDFYTFNVQGGQQISLSLSHIPAGQDYDLYLDDPGQTQVAQSTNTGNADEQITYTAASGGTYYVVVTGYSGYSTTQAYHLRVDLSGGTGGQKTFIPFLQRKHRPSSPRAPHGRNRLVPPGRRGQNTPPVADFTVDPPQGVVGTQFFFDPISSSDAEDSDAWLMVRFDFDGDGVWDTPWDNPTNPPARHTYTRAGTYQATLQVQDTGGLTDTKTKTVQVGDPGNNTPPTARCSVVPTSGPPGTTFTFSAANSSDAQDDTSALQVRWDPWGTFDFRGQTWQPATQPITFTYTRLGIHDVDLIVMDSGYLMDDTSCQVEIVPSGGNTPPTASLVITPTTGTITTTFTMDVRGSRDKEDDVSRLSVRFDWTDDGVYDTGWLNASQQWQHTFAHVWGRIRVRAQVMDSGGLTDEATRTVLVSTPYRLYVPALWRRR